LEKDYLVKKQSDSLGQCQQEQAESYNQNIHNSYIIMCLVDSSFLDSENCLNQIRMALEQRKDIFLCRVDDIEDLQPILNIYEEFKAKPKSIQLNEINIVKPRFNSLLR
jgi:hypothetical protein